MPRLLDRLSARYRAQGYYEGMASGASVLYQFTDRPNRETSVQDVVQAATTAYQTNGIVFACILARAMLLSDASFKFRSLTDKHLFGSPDLRILERPWPDGRTGDLWFRMEQDASAAGNAYFWKVDDELIVRLPADQMVIVSAETTDGHGRTYRELLGYDWEPGIPPPGQRQLPPQHFTVDEIVHWTPIPDPTANFRGMSWLSPVLVEANADSAMTNYKQQYLAHGTPVQALRYAAKLRPDTVDAIGERLRNKYGGVGNAWQTLVLDQGADPVMGKGLQDLDYRAIQQAGEERICAAAGVPPILIGLKEANSGETYEQAMRHFADRVVRPLWRSGCAALEKLVPNMPDRGVQLWVDTTDIAALQDAETSKAQVTQVKAAAALTLVQSGMTRESVIAAVTSGDLGLLVPDPNAPTPGVQGREAIAVAVPEPITDKTVAEETAVPIGRPQKTGSPPGGGQVLTTPQTPASKTPAATAIPRRPDGFVRPSNPSPNGRK